MIYDVGFWIYDLALDQNNRLNYFRQGFFYSYGKGVFALVFFAKSVPNSS
jgi:hypothetical protein